MAKLHLHHTHTATVTHTHTHTHPRARAHTHTHTHTHPHTHTHARARTHTQNVELCATVRSAHLDRDGKFPLAMHQVDPVFRFVVYRHPQFPQSFAHVAAWGTDADGGVG